ncbi:pentapeptide repeat-containing protein [Amycolatopsis sp. NPDC059090]|uniref:pentapeptide repeat-containing protein n=1 Tax=unclassified Amycolatopsis TaxID=2618356 RepID=UPI0036710BF2
MGDDASRRKHRRPLDPPCAATAGAGRLRELTPKAMWTTAVVIAVLTTAAVIVLWWPATSGLNGAALVTARFDALKIGLSIGVGSGGVVALYLTWRRQHAAEADLDNRERALAHQQVVAADTKHHQERVAEDARLDAAARRITELYTKAVEQLGSDKAPVRLGGLYALERLAQDNESQRQTIVNVLCAYLRMPEGSAVPDSNDAADHMLPSLEYAQEREVRTAAQRIIVSHLNAGDEDTYWGPRDLDLSGAHLRDFDLSSTLVKSVDFTGANFSGAARFSDSKVVGYGDFTNVTFSSRALFDGVEFAGGAVFVNSTFRGDVRFAGANFTDFVLAQGTLFEGKADFKFARFRSGVRFEKSKFHMSAQFTGATFGVIEVEETVFEASASFMHSTVSRRSAWSETQFVGDVTFEGSSFDEGSRFIDMTFGAEADFSGVCFNYDPDFINVAFVMEPRFAGTRAEGVEFKLGTL